MKSLGHLAVVMYHYVRPLRGSRYSRIKGLEVELFDRQLDFLGENFKFVSCDDIRACLTGRHDLPENAVLLTFDDGYIDHYSYVFPRLMKRGVRGFFSMPGRILAENKLLDVNKVHFLLASADVADLTAEVRDRIDYYRGAEFVIPSFEELYGELARANRFDSADVIFLKRVLQNALPERLRNIIADELFRKHISISEEAFVNELYMTYDQVETMVKCGMEFGIHGYDHKWLGKLPDDEMRTDIDRAVDFFSNILPKEWVMCFPYGSANDAAISHARARGATLGFSTEVRYADVGVDDSLFLPRFDTNDFPPKSERYKELR